MFVALRIANIHILYRWNDIPFFSQAFNHLISSKVWAAIHHHLSNSFSKRCMASPSIELDVDTHCNWQKASNSCTFSTHWASSNLAAFFLVQVGIRWVDWSALCVFQSAVKRTPKGMIRDESRDETSIAQWYIGVYITHLGDKEYQRVLYHIFNDLKLVLETKSLGSADGSNPRNLKSTDLETTTSFGNQFW